MHKARSDIQQSVRICVSVSDRQVSYAPQDWSNSYVCETVKCRHVENWERTLTAVKDRFGRETIFLNKKMLLREYSLTAGTSL